MICTNIYIYMHSAYASMYNQITYNNVIIMIKNIRRIFTRSWEKKLFFGTISNQNMQ